MSDPNPAVLYERRGACAWITLNRPGERNTMSPDLLAGFEAAVERAKADTDLRAVIVTGAGSTFCAGAHFQALASGFGDAAALPETLRRIYGSFLRVAEIEAPTIAAINGAAVGGGFGLALACDFRVAAEDAKLAANFVRIGLHPGMAISYLLPRLVGVPRATELLLLGRTISGADAERIGLVHRAVPRAAVSAEAERLAAEIAAGAPLAVRAAKATLRRAIGWDPEPTLAAEAAAQAASLRTEDIQEGIVAMAQKRPPKFQGR